MARFVLLIIAAVSIGGIAFSLGSGDRAHTQSQQRAIVRETLDDAVAMVLDRAIDGGERGWSRTSPFRDFDVNGYEVTLEDYRLEDGDQVAAFTLVAQVGGAMVRQTSRYRLEDPNWPGPLWVDAPVAIAEVDPRAKIDGKDPSGTRAPIFDATRFGAYRLDRVLDLNQMSGALGDSLARARGTLAPLEVHGSTASILDRYDSPSPTEVVGKALSEFDPSRDVRFASSTRITDEREFGSFRERSDTRIVHVRGDLTIAASGEVTGGGILVVEGDLHVEGKLRWGGLVVVRSQEQALEIDLESGDVQIRGGLLVDHEAPPPGGHTDLTVLRDLSGRWSPLYGQYGRGTPGYATFRANYPFYDHQHRFDHVEPEVRTFYFAERGRDRHEDHTWLRRTLGDIQATYPGEEVYVRFRNPHNHGAALFHLVAGDSTYSGAVVSGFGGHARPGDRWASPSFAPSELDTLIVDVQSLRMLTHLTDREEPESPYWPWPGSTCTNRPLCVGYMDDRDGALAVQVVRSLTDQPLYEATIYWHTHAEGYPENDAEQAADAAWRAAIQSGTADYGTSLRAGPKTRLLFENAQVARVLNRLGFNQLELLHVGSFVEDVSSPSPTIPSGPSPSGGGDDGGTGGPQIVTVCHKGKTKTVSLSSLASHLGHGDSVGFCPRVGGDEEDDDDDD
ncbi:MAG TPA: hypothetical protein EYQ24_12335 [Bacteroidetes bacterium]|nr:hypothetical protein [Bacteroidota bacterium]